MIDARKYLEGIRSTRRRIHMKMKRVQSLRESLTQITASMDKEQVSHTKNVGIMADTIAMIMDTEKEIQLQTKELVAAKEEANVLLEQIDPEYGSVLQAYYIEGEKIGEIVKELFISRRTVERRLNAGLDVFQAFLNLRESSP